MTQTLYTEVKLGGEKFEVVFTFEKDLTIVDVWLTPENLLDEDEGDSLNIEDLDADDRFKVLEACNYALTQYR